MKFLLLLVVVLVAAWMLTSRSRGRSGRGEAGPASRGPAASGPTAMVACAHCGVHVPKSEAVTDEQQRAYCGEPHRLAGPR